MLDERVLQYWTQSHKTYGAPRITADLHDEGIDVDRKTVAKSMRRQGIEGISPKFLGTGDNDSWNRCHITSLTG